MMRLDHVSAVPGSVILVPGFVILIESRTMKNVTIAAGIIMLSLGIWSVRGPRAASVAPADDERALAMLVESFVKAYNAGDARGVAALFSERARLGGGKSDFLEGRDAIERRFTELFQEDPGQSLAVEVEYLRLIGSDAAIEEGTSTITPGDKSLPAQKARYTVAYIKRDGRWLQDYLREFPLAEGPAETPAPRALKELDWMVGEWIDQSADAEVETTCKWSDDKASLLRSFVMKVKGQAVLSGTQRVGWDPLARQIKSWVHDSDGAFSEGTWARDGERWLIKSTGVTRDGQTASATNIFTRVNPHTISWSSVDRTVGAVVLPNSETIVMVRKPPQPAAARKSNASTGKVR